MNKLLQLLITSILILATFFTMALTWDSCTSKTKTLDEKAQDAIDQTAATEDEFFEEDYTSDSDTYESDDNTATDYSDSDNTSVDYSDASDKIEEVNTYEEAPSEPVRRSTMDGKYLIVAGNFLVEGNAEKMVDRLVRLGYNSAEVSVFDYSQYYTVIASRSDDYGLASSLSREIKSKGIDNYVHTRK